MLDEIRVFTLGHVVAVIHHGICHACVPKYLSHNVYKVTCQLSSDIVFGPERGVIGIGRIRQYNTNIFA